MGLSSELLFEDWRPGNPHVGRMVSRTAVPDLYGLAEQAGSVMFTWRDRAAPVMIVAVGPEWSLATLKIDQMWYSYVLDDASGFVSIDLGGQACEWPRAELLPRDTALPVLMSVPDLAAIKRDFPWLSQARNVGMEPATDITKD